MDLIGKTLGQYHIVEAIGHGGMATVFKARQPVLDRYVAVKVLLPHQADTPEFRERFSREAKAIAQLNHPNILPVIDYGQDGDLIYIVMKYVAGGTLAERLKRPIDLATTTNLVAQISAALDHAHQRGIIHRDVKPSNVLLDENEWVQLADFGLAKLLAGDLVLTTSGMSMGTPAYLSPEQGQGETIDRHADIYSLGVMVYEMVTGRLPFTAETPMGVIIKHIYDQPLPPRGLNPAIPEALEAVLLKGLAKPIEERYHSAGELARALQQAVSDASSVALTPVVGIDSHATPQFSPQQIPPAPIVVSSKMLFEETAPIVPHFIGREAELAAYGARLDRDRFVLITGMAGMGKTTLGAKLARSAALDPDHIFWFTFDHVEKSTADALYWAIATFLENRGEGSLARYLRGEIGAQKPLERLARLNLLITALANGNYVLCFDDFQIVADAPEVAYFFDQIRQRFVELRQPLPARFIIMGRAVPPGMEHLVPESLRGLSLDATRQFLIDRGVVLSPEHAAHLWQQTEGNPKLLELSAGALSAMSDEAAGSFIGSLLRRGDIRDYLMHNIYAALTPTEQVVMGALSVFPGPIERSSIEEILIEDDVGPIAQHLDALGNKHVLEITADDQIDCHDLVREYCYHVLSRRDRDRFHERAAAYCGQEQDWLTVGYHHVQRRAFDTALEVLTSQHEAIINKGQAAALSDLLARFSGATLTAAQRVQLHTTQGQVYRIRGLYEQAVEAFNAALDEAAAEAARAEILLQIGIVHVTAGEYARSTSYLLDSLKMFERHRHLPGIANAHRYLGWAHYRQGRFDQAQQHFLVGEQIAKQLRDRRLLADIGVGMGLVLWKQERLTEARSALEESRRIFHEINDRFGESNALGNLGIIYSEQGDLPKRIQQQLQALHIDEGTGYVQGLSLSLNNLAYAYYLNGQYAEATTYYTRLAALSRDMNYAFTLSLACAGLADCYLAQAQPEAALREAEAAQLSAEQAGGQLERGISYRVLGDVWLALSNLERARQFYEQSIPLLANAGEAEDLARAQHALSHIQPASHETP
jgi:tetratricopeptide (TPR) repeat protein/tRNA A-37 threonylcarbamoyl transferase component Bud32